MNEIDTGLSENGVAAGDVTDDSAVLWAHSLSAGLVRFEVATDRVVERVAVSSLGDVPVHVEVDGLRDGTHYYYRAIGPDGEAIVGQFTTAHDDGYHGLEFGVSGDWRGGLTPYAALSNADDKKLDFFVQLGDTIYGDVRSPAFPGPQAQTVGDYRLKYEETLSERGGENFLADLRASTAVFAMIDDHEVTNDFAGGAPAASDPRFEPTGADFINETQLYANGLQAFHDYQPIERRVWSGTGDDRVDGAPDLYRTQSYGDDAAIFLLDARSFRDEELQDANPTSPADIGRFLVESFDPTRTMLGDPQLERLKQDLLEAEEDGVLWKFVMVPEPIQNLGPVGAADRFEGYAAERTELLKFIDEHDIDNVVFVSADVHGTLVNNLTYQTAPGGAQIAVDAWEISTGAVAFSPALGPTVIGLAAAAGLINRAQAAFYATLPVANDTDSIVNDKDDFLKALINNQLDAFGYDHLGLNDNLGMADGLVDAVLLHGDYVAAHTFGWTQFEIDPNTHVLRVTTYGVPSYTEAEALADPAAIAALTPSIVSQFEVHPDQTLEGGRKKDAAADFNGDLRSDILWRNVDGTTNIFQMNGRTVLDSGNISAQVGNEWKIQDKNDFNADGMADILWRHDNGTTNIYQMNGRTVVDSGNISIQADNSWTIRGTDDFNADGRADILWRHANGTTNIFQMNGRTVVETGNISAQASNDWTIQDTADFNGDGFSDILWRHTNGTTNIFQMNGRTVVDSGNVSAQVDNTWKVQGTGDFNGDGNEDILWRHDNGTTNIHLMNGRTVLNSSNISAQADNTWKVQDVKDYNGDNRADILWRNDNGTTNIFQMNGFTVQDSGNISAQAANDWVIV